MKIGLIDHYLDNFHANNYPAWIHKESGGAIKVAYAYAEIDSPKKDGMTTNEWCKQHGIQHLSSIEEVVENSDAMIVLSPDNPERHEDLCRLPLQRGKPVYVDKTFAENKAAAQRIFAVAKAHNTPCYSSSALRYGAEYCSLDRQQIEGLTSRGPGPLAEYTIHQVEPIVALMGADVSRLQFVGTEKWPAYVLEYRDGRRAKVSHHGWDCPFGMVADFSDGTSTAFNIESDFFNSFIRDLVEFFRTGKAKVPHDETIAVIAVIEAAVKASKAHNTGSNCGQWITV